MKQASDYRQYAQDCRDLAKGMPEGRQRNQLLEMARTWENLAAERSDLVRKHPEVAAGGESDDKAGPARRKRSGR